MRSVLSEEEIAALYACWEASKGAINAILPDAFLRNKFADEYRQFYKKLLQKLARHPERYITRHGGKKNTYSITKTGIRLLRELGYIP